MLGNHRCWCALIHLSARQRVAPLAPAWEGSRATLVQSISGRGICEEQARQDGATDPARSGPGSARPGDPSSPRA
eukprot:8849203-Pyramimonas_sp.AAC.1